MRAVVYQHEEHEGVGLLGPALTEVGFTLVHRFRAVRREDVDAELVVVMGGPMGVYEADQHPFLRDELGILGERLANERPCLGICLGAQMLASAAGAEVFPGKNGFEVGVAPVRWTADAMKDPVIAGARPRTVVAHWHGDTYKAVPGATLLASTDRYSQQAFRLGASYGFQFHLELTARELGHWLELGADDLRQRGKDLAELRAQLPKLQSAERENTELLERLARHLAQAVR
ncbi:glutamine amidotransferase-related protein [Myxococcus stipitatus]|uniref:glutamine amidotransferase-related protein n=1 Tax=Myxococcus stipitatus TaxID=83455 RepID=UPI0030D3245D